MRERIFQDHVNYQQGLMYFLANDPQVPKELRERVRKFGLDPNEFQETGHWPHQLYIREGRRMVSDYVMTQANCESKRVARGLGRPRVLSDGLAFLPARRGGGERQDDGPQRGRLRQGCPKPYPVSYRAIVPREEECANLLVPVCLSASHVAYGSIRMEPVFMILGQSAGHRRGSCHRGRSATPEAGLREAEGTVVSRRPDIGTSRQGADGGSESALGRSLLPQRHPCNHRPVPA